MADPIIALLPEVVSGKVVARFIERQADSPDDVDLLPQARAAQGTVTLTPTSPEARYDDPDTLTTLVFMTPLNLTLDADGAVAEWVPVGEYTVRVRITRPTGIAPKQATITVLPTHTDADPLDIVDYLAIPAPAGVTLVSYALPTGGADGQVLTSQSGQPSWQDAGAATSVPWGSVTSKPDVIAAGATADEARAEIDAQSIAWRPSADQVTGLAEAVQQAIVSSLAAGSNVAISAPDSNGIVTISATTSTGGGTVTGTVWKSGDALDHTLWVSTDGSIPADIADGDLVFVPQV